MNPSAPHTTLTHTVITTQINPVPSLSHPALIARLVGGDIEMHEFNALFQLAVLEQ